MKPSFALNITDTAIGLLHRTARGWLQVGETAFDTADLAEALGYLRGSALGLSPGGLTTKLVLPNSQIKYLELDAPGPTEADRRSQIRAALVGRTPYNVEDLVFDWSGTGAKVQVAVVARETLDEAEAFATEHRFNPVSYVGLPAAGDFKGEPWFGPTRLSVTLLEKGEKVDRDAEAVQVAARDLPKSHPGAAKAAAETSAETGDAATPGVVESERPTRAQRRAAAAAEQLRAADAAIAPVVPPAIATDAIVSSVTDAFPENGEDIAAADFAPPPADFATPSGAADAKREFDHDVAVTQPSVSVNEAFPEVAATVAGPSELPDANDDLPPAPSPAIMAAFASRRAAEMPGAKRNADHLDSPPAARPGVGSDLADRLGGKSTPPPLSRPKVGADVVANVGSPKIDMAEDAPPSVIETAVGKVAGAKPSSAFVTAPNIPGARKRKSLPQGTSAQPGSPDGRKSLTKPGGTFASSKQRGKPRYLGLILTGLLLLFLALIAAWSSFVVSSDEAAQTGTAVASAPADDVAPDETAANAPAVDDEMLADNQDPAEGAASETDIPASDLDPAAEIAADVPQAADDQTTISAANETAAPLPELAPSVAAATDSPNSAPLNEAQDEIFLAAIDAPPLVLDPLSLPQPAASLDALPLPQLEPPPFGTVYQFDADGRIRPTPEGIITPEGVRLVAGKPSLIPPARPDAVIAASVQATSTPAANGAVVAPSSDAVAAVAAPFPSDPALADARPRPRPTGLKPETAQTDDGATLTDATTARVASLRPLARPKAVVAAGEAARLSTSAASLTAQADQAAAVEAAVQAAFQPDANTSPLAVSVSRKPAARPKDMTRAVEAAVAAAVRAPEPQAEVAAVEADSEPETASAAPAIPTRASLAKQATYVNAINLSKINLIGVYGSKSNPYALIRQANGRYKKVKVGDSIDGGKVAAIGASEVRYQKSGRMISLKLPKT